MRNALAGHRNDMLVTENGEVEYRPRDMTGEQWQWAEATVEAACGREEEEKHEQQRR